MGNPFKSFKNLDQRVFLCVIAVELVKTLVIPNPVDVLVLLGLIILFLGWFGDDFR
jgi:hypothetical protein